jgi:hypothetical protein
MNKQKLLKLKQLLEEQINLQDKIAKMLIHDDLMQVIIPHNEITILLYLQIEDRIKQAEESEKDFIKIDEGV